MLRFACPHCRAAMQAPSHKAGHKAAYPKCGQAFHISAPTPGPGTVGPSTKCGLFAATFSRAISGGNTAAQSGRGRPHRSLGSLPFVRPGVCRARKAWQSLLAVGRIAQARRLGLR
jgi:hypothetical protein